MRIIYAGTPEFSVEALRALLASSHEVVAVYTQPDRPSGRGRKLTTSPVKQAALENSIPVEQPLNFKSDATLEQLKAYKADVMIVAAYGLILPEVVLQSFKFGCLNIHASLLPRWRGAAPIQRAMIAGDKKTGVCIMQMEKGLDTGPYYHVLSTDIDPTETASSLHDRLAQLGAKALIEVLPSIFAGSALAIPQNDAAATYAHKLEKAEAKINWQESAQLITAKIRAFNPWPMAFFEVDDLKIRVGNAQILPIEKTYETGEIIKIHKSGMMVAAKENAVNITYMQLPGAKMLAIRDILNGNKLMLNEGQILP